MKHRSFQLWAQDEGLGVPELASKRTWSRELNFGCIPNQRLSLCRCTSVYLREITCGGNQKQNRELSSTSGVYSKEDEFGVVIIDSVSYDLMKITFFTVLTLAVSKLVSFAAADEDYTDDAELIDLDGDYHEHGPPFRRHRPLAAS